jgi:pimeloyl-ACP methyl ester carboxylesterase
MIVLIAAASVGCARATPSPAPVRISFVPHALRLSDGRTVDAELARLTVPERRDPPPDGPPGRTIEVAVLRLRATGPATRPPLVYLPGSPGGASGTQTVAAAALFPFFDALRAGRDVLVMDYRGSGLSTPRLDCPATPVPADAMASRERFLAVIVESSRRCADTLRASGVDTRGYTWAAVADDVADLRRALGVPRVALLGFSSGTHAALAFLRDRSAEVERAVLVGVEGPDDTRKLPSAVDRQLERIAALARDAPELRGEVPDLVALVRRTLDSLQRSPAVVEVTPRGGAGAARGPVSAFALQYLTAKSLAGPEEFAGLPVLYRSLARGDVSALTRVVQRVAQRPPPNALTYLLDGASGVSPARAARIAREAGESPLGDAVNFPFPDVLASWRHPDLGPRFRAPVRSTVPTLFVTGTLDGNTPPAQADAVRSGFADARHLLVENGGHGAPFTAPAALSVIAGFLDGRRVADTTVAAPAWRFAPVRP